MKSWRFIIVGCFLSVVTEPSLLMAQPPMAKPGPEQEALKRFEGDWDATVSAMGMESKAQASYRIGYGGFWLIEEFKGELAGTKFEGRGTTGYDPFKKKYISTWIDSMSPTMISMEGSFDKEGNYSETGSGVEPDGKPMKLKSVFQFKDQDNFVFTMYVLSDGKENEGFKITYQRKK